MISIPDNRMEQSQEYGNLPLTVDGSEGAQLRVCIASPDFVGPVRNGGVGTAFTALGEALAAAGHKVTLLFLGGTWCENLTIEYWITYYAGKGIDFVPMPSPEKMQVDSVWSIKKSYEAYLWLKEREFDIIHFSEWCGPGYFCMLAKRQGLAFTKTVFCVHTHGPTLWHKLSNGDYLDQVIDLELDYMERQSVLMADVLVTPSRYLIQWMKDQKWKLPEKIYLQQYVMPNSARFADARQDFSIKQVDEIVFFGRLEERKGMILFCDALDQLAELKGRDFKLTFLGKTATVQGMKSEDYIQKRSEKWRWNWQIISDKDQLGALQYLKRDGVLAVMPSLADNLPNTVLECLGGRIPFLASLAGGIPEMIADEDISRVCFHLRPDDFSQKMNTALQFGIAPARMAVDIQENEQAWAAWHAKGLPGVRHAEPVVEGKIQVYPLISVCIPHFNRPEKLQQALSSLDKQDYPNFEVIVVDDGSTNPESIKLLSQLEKKFNARGWQILHQKNSYPGAARNNASRHAHGEYLFFMDDDNLAKPAELSTIMRVAQYTQSGIITCISDIFYDGQDPLKTPPDSYKRWLFLGGAAPVGLFLNCFGDINSLIRKEVFESVGGFTEDYGIGYEDWEFFAKAALMGHTIEVIPEALFWYRKTLQGVNETTPLHANYQRITRPYLDMVPENLRNLVLIAQGMKMKIDRLSVEVSNTRIEKERPSELDALLVAGNSLIKGGETDSAQKVYTLALKKAQELLDPVAAMKGLVGIGVAFEKIGEMELANNIFDSAKRIAIKTANISLFDVLLQEMKQDLEERGLSNRLSAEALFKEIVNSDDLEETITTYADDLDEDIVRLILENAKVAEAAGHTDLVDGLDTLAEYIQDILAHRDEVLSTQSQSPKISSVDKHDSKSTPGNKNRHRKKTR